MAKITFIQQHSEEDCGSACLVTIAKFYGNNFAMSRVREIIGTGTTGTTLLGLHRGAEKLGFNARMLKGNEEILKHLDQIPLPMIIHWQGYHWVVFYGKKRQKYIIADPAVGIRYLSEKELLEGWDDGVMLALEPDEIRFNQQPQDEVNSLKGLQKFIYRILPYKWILGEAIFLNITIGLLSLAFPIMMQLLTDDVLVRGDTQLLKIVAISVMVMSLFQTAVDLVQSQVIGHFSKRLELGLILEYGYRLLHLPLTYFETRRSGEVVSRLADSQRINDLITDIIVTVPSELFIAIISLIVMIFYSWQLTLASIFVSSLILLIVRLFLPTLERKSREEIVLGTENQGFLVETFRGIQILKTSRGTDSVWQEFQNKYSQLANVEWKLMKFSFYVDALVTVITQVSSIGLLWLGSYFVINQTLSIGQLLAFNAMNGNFTRFINLIAQLIDEFTVAKVAIQRLQEVIEATPESDSKKNKPWLDISENSDITCTDLNFHHLGRVELLKDFNLTIPGGKTIALIGQSGCGKSTLAKLMASLYFPQSGNIRFGDYNQNDLDLECRRQQVVLVPQEAEFWTRSIIENFILSYPDISFEEIVTACQVANADEFISNLPEQYQTILGEFGANLSGGQKKRLALARGIVKNPPILILDESTSALDPISEAEILDNLLELRQGKTTILISHRSRVINRAEYIIYLEKGTVKVEGNINKVKEIEGKHLDFLKL